jgi:hypothetical protein
MPKGHPVTALEIQNFARLIRGRDLTTQLFDNAADLGDLQISKTSLYRIIGELKG